MYGHWLFSFYYSDHCWRWTSWMRDRLVHLQTLKKKISSTQMRRRWPRPTWTNTIIPDTIALPSGIYTIENVKYRNRAMLLNANEGEVVAGSPALTNVGEKVRILEMWIQSRSLTKSSRGASTVCQTELLLFRIDSTAIIMRLTLFLISQTREQFPVFGTLHWRPSNGASIPPIAKEVTCTSFCKSLHIAIILRISDLNGYCCWSLSSAYLETSVLPPPLMFTELNAEV
jgi:hypothetical protein